MPKFIKRGAVVLALLAAGACSGSVDGDQAPGTPGAPGKPGPGMAMGGGATGTPVMPGMTGTGGAAGSGVSPPPVMRPVLPADRAAIPACAKGIEPAAADKLAERIMLRPTAALDTLAREELGLDPNDLSSPLVAAGSSFGAFALGAFVPVIPFLVASGTGALVAAAAASGCVLALVGLSISLFTGPSLRAAVEAGQADFIPIFLSDIPDLFRSGQVPLDAALVQLSPPDRHGYCTLGTSIDTARAADSW
jgi:hypothetical protein